ncbi:hypothetical protein M422DRAFT_221820 [Sphaerobolus stellatus SS14]|nr:hypothetical protein M422DRAFT_221820 [Sphaerobolus stellatus SS14]
MATKLQLFSLNCWGLKYVAKNRTARIHAIAEFLATSSYDIIALQELWVYADYQHIRGHISKELPFSKFFYSGALGSGLAIFSRFPIISTHIQPYALNGTPLDVAGGDWFVGKSAASVVVDHPILGETEIFNTHLYARGGEDGPEERRAHRLVNVWDLSKLIRNSAGLGRYVILMGDFNNVPHTLPMRLLREHAVLTDAWEQTHPRQPPITSIREIPTPQRAIYDFGVTADSPLNTYSAGKPLDGVARKHQGKRLDYVFFRQPSQRTSNNRHLLKATQTNVALTERVPGHSFSFSDHFGLEATLEISTSDSSQNSDDTPRLFDSRMAHETLETTIQALIAHYRIARSAAKFQLLIFALSLCIAIGLIVSSAFLPQSWINPIFVLFTVVVTWLGTTMLYSGFIWGNWEARTLTNVIEELELLKLASSRQTDDAV